MINVSVELAHRAALWLMLGELALVLAVVSFAVAALGLRAVGLALLHLLGWWK